jgi:flavin-dependent dehydrogenase
MSDLPQSILEPILVEQAVEAGAQVRFGCEYVSYVDLGDHVEVTLRNRDDGNEYNVNCNYLVDADGARSQVVEALGIPIIGKQINSAFNRRSAESCPCSVRSARF